MRNVTRNILYIYTIKGVHYFNLVAIEILRLHTVVQYIRKYYMETLRINEVLLLLYQKE